MTGIDYSQYLPWAVEVESFVSSTEREREGAGRGSHSLVLSPFSEMERHRSTATPASRRLGDLVDLLWAA
jgi:hypothetical protein